jgi:hypothetical protein
MGALLDSAPEIVTSDLRDCGGCLDRGYVLQTDQRRNCTATPCPDCAQGQVNLATQRDWLLGRGRWAVLGPSPYWTRKIAEHDRKRAEKPIRPDEGLPF